MGLTAFWRASIMLARLWLHWTWGKCSSSRSRRNSASGMLWTLFNPDLDCAQALNPSRSSGVGSTNEYNELSENSRGREGDSELWRERHPRL